MTWLRKFLDTLGSGFTPPAVFIAEAYLSGAYARLATFHASKKPAPR